MATVRAVTLPQCDVYFTAAGRLQARATAVSSTSRVADALGVGRD
ncbi:MAG: hypothetical protein ACHP7J_00205 [Terriglobales bacterium]